MENKLSIKINIHYINPLALDIQELFDKINVNQTNREFEEGVLTNIFKNIAKTHK